mmetsp:Transcript_103732/g.291884  ORF Transcript_103732/g.291884 Transcript_103732/m.291884 type:complete len:249 (-) Transcript_103732:1172-1918(-)
MNLGKVRQIQIAVVPVGHLVHPQQDLSSVAMQLVQRPLIYINSSEPRAHCLILMTTETRPLCSFADSLSAPQSQTSGSSWGSTLRASLHLTLRSGCCSTAMADPRASPEFCSQRHRLHSIAGKACTASRWVTATSRCCLARIVPARCVTAGLERQTPPSQEPSMPASQNMQSASASFRSAATTCACRGATSCCSACWASPCLPQLAPICAAPTSASSTSSPACRTSSAWKDPRVASASFGAARAQRST